MGGALVGVALVSVASAGGRGLLCTAPCSTVGNIEGQWAMKTGNVTSLSAELLVDCDDSNDPQQ